MQRRVFVPGLVLILCLSASIEGQSPRSQLGAGECKNKIVVWLGARELGHISRGATPVLSFSLAEHEISLPLATVSWASSWTWNPMKLVVCGADAQGDEVLLEYTDTDGDSAPDVLTSTLLLPGAAGDHAFVRTAPYPVDIWVLDRSAPAVRQILDSDADGTLDTVAPVFSSYPELSSAVRIFSAADVASGFEVALSLPGDSSFDPLQFRRAVRLVDTDDDGAADIEVAGYEVDLWPLPAPLEPSIAANVVAPGMASLRVFGDGSTTDVVTIRDLSFGGATLGTAAMNPPETLAQVSLAAPLEAGHFIELESLSGTSAVYFVPPADWYPLDNPVTLPTDPAAFQAMTWDVDDDGVRDYVFAEEEPDRLYIGLRDAAGNVTSTHTLLFPTEANGILDTGDPDRLTFTGGEEGMAVNDPLFAFERVAGAPDAGLAQFVGDIDGDGLGTDALVVIGDAAQVEAWYRIDAPGGGTWSSSILSAPATDSIFSYSVKDHDGDGDLDLLTTVIFEDSEHRQELFVWDGSGFSHSNFPILVISEYDYAPSGPLAASFGLEFIVDPIALGGGGGNGTGIGSGSEDLAYVMLLTDTGTTPGMTIDGVHVPMNVSPFMDAIILLGNSEYTVDFQQLVPSDGIAAPQLNVPAEFIGGPALIHGGYLIYGVESGLALARSNIVQFEVAE